MKNNFVFLLVIYILYKLNQKIYKIKEKKYITYQGNNLIKNKIEILQMNKNTIKILKKMLNFIHYIFMCNKIIYYASDEILKGYAINKKISIHNEYINLYVIEETFDFQKIENQINNGYFEIIKYFGFYKIISKDINYFDRNSVCINIYVMEKVKDKILFSSNTNLLYLKLFQLREKNEHEFDDVFPIQKIRINNMNLCIPNNYEKILSQIYGNNYQKNITLNNNYSPFSFIYTKITGIRDTTININ